MVGLTGELHVLASTPRVRAVSVSVAATVRDNHVVQSSVLDWERVDLGRLAVEDARLLVANDATLEAVAESRRGASRGAGSALHLTVLTGVGGGLVVEGRTLLGANQTRAIAPRDRD